MRRVLLIFLKRFTQVFALLLLCGLLVVVPIAALQLTQLHTFFFIAFCSSIVGLMGLLLCIGIAPLLRCSSCGRKAVMFKNDLEGFDGGNTVAIFDTQKCHHCGQQL